MIKLKNLLTEDPDSIKVDNKSYMFSDIANVEWIFSFYKDTVDKDTFYIAINPVTHKILSDNKNVNDEIKTLLTSDNKEKFIEVNKTITLRPLPQNYPNTILNPFVIVNGKFISGIYTHMGLRKILCGLRRIETFTLLDNVTPISGRIFKIKDEYYITFWQSNYDIKKYKLKLERMLNDMGLSPYSTHWQFASFSMDKFLTFDQAFSHDVEADKDELSFIKRVKSDLERKRKLHAKKALLTKNIVQALQDKPEDMQSLQAKLEDKFGMPLAQIRAKYGNIPINQLLAREIRETIRGFKKN